MLKRFSLAVACLGMLFVAYDARGDGWNKKTVITFSQSVELPGVTLPAGTYVFKLVDLPGTRNVVQVFNKEENQVYATILAITDIHLTPHENTYLGFEERTAGVPQAIREWFYPGDTFGLEFVYPKARAQELARETGKPVLAAEVTPVETPAELQEVEVVPENPEIEFSIAPQGIPEIGLPTLAEAAKPDLPALLPQTAGPIPALTLAGMLCLVGAGAIGVASARIHR